MNYESHHGQLMAGRRGRYTPLSSRIEPRAGKQRRKLSPNGEQMAQALGYLSIGAGVAKIAAPGSISKLIGLKEDHSTMMRVLGVREIVMGMGILARPKPAGWLWSRAVGDAVDALLLGAAVVTDGVKTSRIIPAVAVVAGATALDVLCARQLGRGGEGYAVREHAITINRPLEDVYRFWRNLENLPRFMSHLESVRVTGDRTSHWVAKAPAGRTVQWDAEITEDWPGKRIAWRSLEGADIDNAGQVGFERAPGGRGTEVRVRIDYKPPAGKAGVTIARLLGEEPGQQLKGDLYRFKQVMETGEVVHSDSSIHRGRYPAQPSREGLGPTDRPAAVYAGRPRMHPSVGR